MWLRKMLKNIRAQSTAEYAILIGVVVAAAAGFLAVSMKNAIGTKHDSAVDYFLRAGTATLEEAVEGEGVSVDIIASQEEVRHTTQYQEGFADTRVRHQGGAEQALQTQRVKTDQVSIGKITAGGEAEE